PPRVTDSARLVPGARAAPFGCAGLPVAGSACPAGSTCAPLILSFDWGPVPGREKRPPPGDRLWSLRARTSHRLRGGHPPGPPSRVTDSARLVPGARAAPFGCAGLPVAGSACPAGSTCAPLILSFDWGPVPGREKRPPPGDRLWSLRARTSHRLRGGATTGSHR